MKLKKTKLLKALATVGAFRIVSIVPVIASSCSFYGDNNLFDENSDNNNQDWNEENNNDMNDDVGLDEENHQENLIELETMDSINKEGPWNIIYDNITGVNKKSFNDWIAEDIVKNPRSYFYYDYKNYEDYENYYSNLEVLLAGASVTVEGGFYKTPSPFIGEDYEIWSKTPGIKTVVLPGIINEYKEDFYHFGLNTLSGFKTTLQKNIEEICNRIPDLNLINGTDYKITDKGLGLTEGNLLHVNVEAKENGKNISMDLGIPLSNISLISEHLMISVMGKGIQTANNLDIFFSYRFGISDKVKKITPSATLDISSRHYVIKVLKALGYIVEGYNGNTIDNYKLSRDLGIYNCKFTAKDVRSVDGQAGKYRVILDATPRRISNYFQYRWEDGSIDSKEISFIVTLYSD